MIETPTETVTATEANRHFSELLRKVQAGKSVTILSRGRPVATIAPVMDELDDETIRKQTELMAYLKSRPITITGPWTREELYE